MQFGYSMLSNALTRKTKVPAAAFGSKPFALVNLNVDFVCDVKSVRGGLRQRAREPRAVAYCV